MKKILKNKKGFTLVELLAVIVVLAVVMLIASSGVGSAMTKARKSSLGIEGTELINAAKNAYQLGVLDGSVQNNNACYSLEYLYNDGDYNKSSKDGYTGSVLVVIDGNIVNYYFWISNGSFSYEGVQAGVSQDRANNNPTASSDCNGGTLTVDGKTYTTNTFFPKKS